MAKRPHAKPTEPTAAARELARSKAERKTIEAAAREQRAIVKAIGRYHRAQAAAAGHLRDLHARLTRRFAAEDAGDGLAPGAGGTARAANVPE